MNIVGPPLGRLQLFADDFFTEWNWSNQLHNSIFNGQSEASLSKYIYTYLTSGQNDLKRHRINYGTRSFSLFFKQDNISVTKSRSIIFPMPPLAEQHRIVAKVDELMALCDQLKTRLCDAQTTQLDLADTVVENALN